MKKFITFGSFNNYNKINNVIEVWINILKKVSGSKLLLKSSTKKNDKFKTCLKKQLEQSVIYQHLNFLKITLIYIKIDIALDTFLGME